MLPVMSLLIEENVPLAPMTTLQIGGRHAFAEACNTNTELRRSFCFLRPRRQLPVFVLGGGSNVPIADDGFAVLVVRVALRGITWNNDDDQNDKPLPLMQAKAGTISCGNASHEIWQALNA